MAYFQTDNLWVNRLPDGVAELVLDVSGSKVNMLNRIVLAELDQALDRVAEDTTFRLLIVRTGKPASFCAGLAAKALSDISSSEFGEITTLGQDLCSKLARLRLPSVGMIS